VGDNFLLGRLINTKCACVNEKKRLTKCSNFYLIYLKKSKNRVNISWLSTNKKRWKLTDSEESGSHLKTLSTKPLVRIFSSQIYYADS
jgi:hypothetical protein